MSDDTEENYLSIHEGIKSIPIDQLEKCIATAVTNALNGSKLNCHITKLEASAMHGVEIKLKLTNDLSDVGF